jgi:hypothetical protein
VIGKRSPRNVTFDADDPSWSKLPIVACLQTAHSSEGGGAGHVGDYLQNGKPGSSIQPRDTAHPTRAST